MSKIDLVLGVFYSRTIEMIKNYSTRLPTTPTKAHYPANWPSLAILTTTADIAPTAGINAWILQQVSKLNSHLPG
jgi:hypothetical protein